ncbi:MAG: alcohol dehydrogenase catalytic domain-containing protein, partial [Methylobacterium organophilum]|nr:alcohol dehydrogenase catalytic domain-containing protein [Methylobacterium organophilum]
MRALQLFGDRDLRLTEIEPPPAPGADEVRIRIRAVGLNFIDVWGFRGMAFAKRKMPLIVGAEAAGIVESVGPGVTGLAAGDRVVPYGAMTCGRCKACRE